MTTHDEFIERQMDALRDSMARVYASDGFREMRRIRRRRFWKERIQHALYLVGLVMAVAVFFKAAWVLETVKGWM